MMEKCFDEGIIQAFLDGELELDLVDKVSRHVALCEACAFAVASAEEEMEFAFSALDNEFSALVPTERLWTKINSSIEAQSKHKSIWQSVFSFLTSPSSVAFASLLIVFGLFVGLYNLKNNSGLSDKDLASNTKKPESTVVNINITDSPSIPGKSPSTISTADENSSQTDIPVFIDKKPENDSDFKATTAYYRPERIRKSPRPRTETPLPDDVNPVEALAAEDSYVKTISTLEKTVNSRKDEVLRPSARFAFERDMAVADDTIERMKEEVRKNPKNEAARVLLRTSYQNKINLLSSVAEKTELMASLN